MKVLRYTTYNVTYAKYGSRGILFGGLKRAKAIAKQLKEVEKKANVKIVRIDTVSVHTVVK